MIIYTDDFGQCVRCDVCGELWPFMALTPHAEGRLRLLAHRDGWKSTDLPGRTLRRGRKTGIVAAAVDTCPRCSPSSRRKGKRNATRPA